MDGSLRHHALFLAWRSYKNYLWLFKLPITLFIWPAFVLKVRCLIHVPLLVLKRLWLQTARQCKARKGTTKAKQSKVRLGKAQGRQVKSKTRHKKSKSQERQARQAKQGKIQPRQHVPSILSDCPTRLLPWYSLADLW